jgi:hypothetical protein
MDLTPIAKSIELPDFHEPSRWERFLDWLGFGKPEAPQPFIVEVAEQNVPMFRELAGNGLASDFSFTIPATDPDNSWQLDWTGVVTSVKEQDGIAKVEIMPVLNDAV